MKNLKNNLLALSLLLMAAFAMSFSSSTSDSMIDTNHESITESGPVIVKGRWKIVDGGGGTIGIKCVKTKKPHNCFYIAW